MDTLDILLLGAKEGDMVDFVLKQNTCYFVSDKLLWLDAGGRVGRGVEVVRVERP